VLGLLATIRRPSRLLQSTQRSSHNGNVPPQTTTAANTHQKHVGMAKKTVMILLAGKAISCRSNGIKISCGWRERAATAMTVLKSRLFGIAPASR
jgi:hypothetical protein